MMQTTKVCLILAEHQKKESFFLKKKSESVDENIKTHQVREELQTLTGGVAAALTRKEAFLEKPNGDWSDLGPRLCLVASAEKVRDDDDTRACAAMLLIYNSFVASE